MDAYASIFSGARVHLVVRLFANRSDDHFSALGASGIQQQKRKPPVAGNQAQLCGALLRPGLGRRGHIRMDCLLLDDAA